MSQKRARLFSVVVGVSALLAIGCAGTKSPNDDDAPARYVIIDDIEGSTGQIQWRPASGGENTTPGRWDTEAGSQCGNLAPLPGYLGGDWPHALVETPYPTFSAEPSRQAVRLRTTAPLVNTWGATLAFDFAKKVPAKVNQPLDPNDRGDPATCTPPVGVERESLTDAAEVDLRGYRGVAFYARAVPDAGTSSISVKLHDHNTDPRGGVCDQTVGSDDECYNAFGKRVLLDAEFRRYTVLFDELAQEPRWGKRVPEPDLERVYSLVFQIFTPGGTCDPPSVCPGVLPELTFDVWIDDVAFVER